MSIFRIIAGANYLFEFKEKYGISRENYRNIFCHIKVHNNNILSQIEKNYDTYHQNDKDNYHTLINVIDGTEYKINNKKQIKKLKKDIDIWPHYLILLITNLKGAQKNVIRMQLKYFFLICFLVVLLSQFILYVI